jgi:hypothetical protein
MSNYRDRQLVPGSNDDVSRKRRRLTNNTYIETEEPVREDQHVLLVIALLPMRFAALCLQDPLGLMDLPDDVFYHVLQYLRPSDLKRSALVCSRLARLVKHHFNVSAISTATRIRPWMSQVFRFDDEHWLSPTAWLRFLHYRNQMSKDVILQKKWFESVYLSCFPLHTSELLPIFKPWPRLLRQGTYRLSFPSNLWLRFAPDSTLRYPVRNMSQVNALLNVLQPWVTTSSNIASEVKNGFLGGQEVSALKYDHHLRKHIQQLQVYRLFRPSLEKWLGIGVLLVQTLTWCDSDPWLRATSFVFDAPLMSLLIIRFLTLWYSWMYDLQCWRAHMDKIFTGSKATLSNLRVKKAIRSTWENRMLRTGEVIVTKGASEESFLSSLRSHLLDAPWCVNEGLKDLSERAVCEGNVLDHTPRLDRVVSTRIALELGVAFLEPFSLSLIHKMSLELDRLERKGSLQDAFDDIRHRGGSPFALYKKIDYLPDSEDAHDFAATRKTSEQVQSSDLYVYLAQNGIFITIGA